MAEPVPPLPQLIDDGRWLAHRYDDAGDMVHFRLVPREAQREMTFLTDFEIGGAPQAVHSRADFTGTFVRTMTSRTCRRSTRATPF